MQSVSGPTATVVQVSPKNHGTAPTIIQQNGQHILVGKLASANRPATTTTELGSLQSVHSTNSQTIYPSHYIETIAEQTVYAANGENGPIQYQSYTPIIYAPVTGGQTYYQSATGQVLTSAFTGNASTVGAATGSGTHTTPLGASHAQLVTHQGATYLLQGGQLDDDGSPISHTAKASPVTVQWLVENYETAEGVSLPRSTLYFHYLQHCNEHKLEPMNPASFGKLIRSVFFGLRTRRLGTRGNSKYHYYGIRIKPTSSLNHYVEDAGFSLRHYPNYHRQTMEAAVEWKNFTNASTAGRLKASGTSNLASLHGQHSTHPTIAASLHAASQHTPHSEFATASVRSEKSVTSNYMSSTTAGGGVDGMQSLESSVGGVTTSAVLSSPLLTTTGQHQHAQFLGEASSALPNLDEICRSAGLPVPGETDLSALSNDSSSSIKSIKGKVGTTVSLDPSFCADVITFCRLYALSAGYMLDSVVNLDFTAIETVWKAFWRTEEVRDSRLKQSLSQERLYTLVSDSSVLQFVRLYDHTFYQSLAEVLIPNVLRPIPHTLTQAIRNFAKSLEGWMRQATQGLDSTLVGLKISAVSALAQTLRRYTSLNHLAQAARTVLKNANQINQMLADLNRVDFNNVQEQASWVCQCSDATVSQLEQDFKRILHKHASLEEWAQWLDTVVTGILQPLEGNSLAYTRAAHQLILKWSFYSSMVIRDLTLRSAASFGSFHLIRLLYDEYIFYLVEHKVAAHLGMTPVAVMGEMGRHLTQQHYAHSRLHSDLAGRRELKPAVLTCPTDEFDTLSYDNNDSLSNEHHLPLSDTHRSKTRSSEDEDEEVDEYLDDEEDVDDSTGDESAMLKHAHASVQAYCRSTNASSKPTSETLGFESTVALSVNIAERKEAIVPEVMITVTGNTSPGAVCTLSEGGDGSTHTPMMDLVNADASIPSETTESSLPEPTGSPPPILAAPNPVRKVVRVTTFCDAQPLVSEGEPPPNPVGACTKLDPSLCTASTTTYSDQLATPSATPGKCDMLESNPVKRIKLA